MKLFFDTNVVVDVLGNRAEFVADSKAAIRTTTRKGWRGAIAAKAVTDIYYILRKHESDVGIRKTSLMAFMGIVEVVDTTRELCLRAFRSPVNDFEDAVLVESAIDWSADLIITRNTRDFADAAIEAITPAELLLRFPEARHEPDN